MIALIPFAILVTQPTVNAESRCLNPSSDREKIVCEYLEAIDKLEIKSVDTVAYGTHHQMFALKPHAKECGATLNRVDPLDVDRAVFDIVNASKFTKECVLKWIKDNEPQLELTSEKKKELGFLVD